VKNNVDTSTYPTLKAFLKEQCPKAQTFSIHEVTKIISEGLEEKFLMLKVAFLIGQKFTENVEHSDQKMFLIVDVFINLEMENAPLNGKNQPISCVSDAVPFEKLHKP
ncbi:hypothetical protein BDFB_014220, partial [Asbolus verrucosus]